MTKMAWRFHERLFKPDRRRGLVGIEKCRIGVHEVFEIPRPGFTTVCVNCGATLTAGERA